MVVNSVTVQCLCLLYSSEWLSVNE